MPQKERGSIFPDDGDVQHNWCCFRSPSFNPIQTAMLPPSVPLNVLIKMQPCNPKERYF
jgi:hypothetical protein